MLLIENKSEEVSCKCEGMFTVGLPPVYDKAVPKTASLDNTLLTPSLSAQRKASSMFYSFLFGKPCPRQCIHKLGSAIEKPHLWALAVGAAHHLGKYHPWLKNVFKEFTSCDSNISSFSATIPPLMFWPNRNNISKLQFLRIWSSVKHPSSDFYQQFEIPVHDHLRQR